MPCIKCCSVSRMKLRLSGIEGPIRIVVYDHDHGLLCAGNVHYLLLLDIARWCKLRVCSNATLTLDGGHDLIGNVRVSSASGVVGLPCTFRGSFPVTFTSLKEGWLLLWPIMIMVLALAFDMRISTCRYPETSLELEITHKHTHLFMHTQTTLQELRASVSTIVHRIKEDFKLVGRLAITW